MFRVNKKTDEPETKAPLGLITGIAHLIDRDLFFNAPFHEIAKAGEVKMKIVGQRVIKAQIIIDHSLG